MLPSAPIRDFPGREAFQSVGRHLLVPVRPNVEAERPQTAWPAMTMMSYTASRAKPLEVRSSDLFDPTAQRVALAGL